MIQRMMLAFVLIGAAAGADAPDWRKAELKDVAFEFRLVQDLDEIEGLLGDRLDEDFTLVEVRLRALYGTKVELDRTSFTLRSFRGNLRSEAQSPDRIAGPNVLTLEQGKAGGGVFSQSRTGIPVGGMPGTTGQPRRVGSQIPDTFGGPVGSSSPSSVETQSGLPAPEQDMSLYGRLERWELPLDAGDADVNGYLYFQVDPKQNRKHLSLSYDGRYGEFRVSFEK